MENFPPFKENYRSPPYIKLQHFIWAFKKKKIGNDRDPWWKVKAKTVMITYNVFLLLCSQVSAYRGNIFSHYADSTCFSISMKKLVSFKNYPPDHNDQWIILPCHSFQSLLGDPLCCRTQNCLLWQWYASWSQEKAYKSIFTKQRQKKTYFEKINLNTQ